MVLELRSTAAALVGPPVALRVHARDRQAWKAGMLGRHGFVVDRTFHRMARALTEPIRPAVVPDGYVVRPLAGAAEAPAWCAAFVDAFAGHYDDPVYGEQDRLRTMLTPEYVAATDLVAVGPDGGLAGIAWSFRERMADGSARGNVNYVAVLPEHRGRGVARALLLTSLDRLRGLGLDSAVLAVDSGNQTSALRLYESAGFEKLDEAIVYLAEIE